MKKYFHFIFILFLAVSMNSYCFAANPMEDNEHKGHRHERKTEGGDLELSGKLENGTRVIEIKASRYKFEPDPIVAKLGEKVRLVVTSSDVTHGLAIDEFKVKLSVSAEKTESVEFVANKKGAFHAYCSVYCGPGHSHMHASFIVK